MIENLKTFKILVVEDNSGDFMIVEDLLTEQFVEPIIIKTTTFKSTSEILSLNEVHFDCILLDLTLSDCSGQELIAKILPIASPCPVIILTGYTDVTFSMQALSAGIADYLIKDELNGFLLYKSIVYAIERKKAKEKLEETLLQLEKRVEERTKELSEKNKDIFDSITYAKRIQIGLLTPHSQLKELFPTSFILSEPQNIVSGDFFWCHQKHNKKFVVVADCTGHGVPGALISIIGNNLLNTIIINESIDNPSEILQMLDQRLKEAMKGAIGEIKDGMDIALCVIDTYFKEVYFAGAYRPLFVSDENGKINELMGNPFSVGGGHGEKEKKFETKRFSILPGQRIYLTSDGYYSQFGGPRGKKFMKKNFREKLESLQKHPVVEQKNNLRQTLIEWEGKNERVDDIMVVGIEL